MNVPRVQIGGVGVDALNLPIAVEAITECVKRRERIYVVAATIHNVVCCLRDATLLQIHHDAALVTPDGMPLVGLLKASGFSGVGRTYGPDLLLATCERQVATGCRHAFYGGARGVAAQLALRLQTRFPGLRVAGTWSPPFRSLSRQEDDEAVQRINDSGADVVWVGLGAPKQEYWMAEHRARLTAPVMVGVGYAFDIHSGIKRQAPRWMREAGMEWAFRLVQEPRRLWPRTIIEGPLFARALMRQGFPWTPFPTVLRNHVVHFNLAWSKTESERAPLL